MTVCLVLGGAACLHDDIAAYDGPVDSVVACNDAGAEWPGELAAWVSLHPEYLDIKGWRQKRAERGYPPAKRYIGHLEWQRRGRKNPDWLEFSDYRFPGQERSGSSGLFAAKVALIDLGFDRAVFCGVPLTHSPHFFDSKVWPFAHSYQEIIETLDPQYRARLRSMSGWTRDFLGSPEQGNTT